jgi:hypothetical protein
VKKENLIHSFIIDHYKDFNGLLTTQQQVIKIMDIGIHNSNAGPDFICSHVKIGNSDLYGNIEVHVCASEWYSHKHDIDPLYNNVILHIVLHNDKLVYQNNSQQLLPTLILPNQFHEKYCASSICSVQSITDIDNFVKSRYERKYTFIMSLLERCNGDWETVAINLLSYYMGFNVNNDQMLQLTFSISTKIVQILRHNYGQLLALFVGQAGFIDQYDDDIKHTYEYWKTKYHLLVPDIKWKFLRLRPMNFPQVRVTQLVNLLHLHESLSSWFLDDKIGDGFDINEAHKLGTQSKNSLIINVIIAYRYSYMKYHLYTKRANETLYLLNILPVEINAITKKFITDDNKNKIKTSYYSQAIIELYNNYCKTKKCLNCPLSIKFSRSF